MVMEGRGKRPTRLADWMVGLAALGILVSIGVPNYLGMEKRLRRESLVSQTSLAGAELYRWIHASLGGKATALAQGRGGDEAGAVGNARVLESYARFCNERLGAVSPLSRKPLFVVEPGGKSPDDCARDGTIHLIPVATRDGKIVGAHLVATNTSWAGGPRGDGILASYRTWQGEAW